ncbi:MAG: hypothetical protein CMA10_04520 [Euryarchaeota archaeon]|nr:hypothetical protein [Euryarchaeota archaeon]
MVPQVVRFAFELLSGLQVLFNPLPDLPPPPKRKHGVSAERPPRQPKKPKKPQVPKEPRVPRVPKPRTQSRVPRQPPDGLQIPDPSFELPDGWTILESRRTVGLSLGHLDRFFYSPEGRKYRSLLEAKRHIQRPVDSNPVRVE